jgi:flagellar biosynthesis protein FliR
LNRCRCIVKQKVLNNIFSSLLIGAAFNFHAHFFLQTDKGSYQLLKLEGFKLADAVGLAEKQVDPIRGLLLCKLATLLLMQIWVLEVYLLWNQLS